MKYVLLIYTEQPETAYSDAIIGKKLAVLDAYQAEAQREDVLIAAETLYPITLATTIRVRDGKTLITDGPFAQTEAQLEGCYVLECVDAEIAETWAAKHPSLRDGMIEIRPATDIAQR